MALCSSISRYHRRQRIIRARAILREAKANLKAAKENAKSYLDPDIIARGRSSAPFLRGTPTFGGMPMSPAEMAMHERNFEEYTKMMDGQNPDPSVYAAETAAAEAAEIAYDTALAAADAEAFSTALV